MAATPWFEWAKEGESELPCCLRTGASAPTKSTCHKIPGLRPASRPHCGRNPPTRHALRTLSPRRESGASDNRRALQGVLRSFVDRVSSGRVQESDSPEEDTVRSTVLALVIAAMATPVYAQTAPNFAAGDVKLKTDVDVKKEQERESGYKSGVSKIPDAKGKVDLWGGVRSATTPASGQNQSRSSSK